MQDRSETGKEARNVRRNQTETNSALWHSCSTLLQSFLILTQRCIACWPSAGYGICRVCSSSTTHSLLPPKSMANKCDKSDGRQQSIKPVGVENVVGRMTDSLSATLSDWGSLLEILWITKIPLCNSKISPLLHSLPHHNPHFLKNTSNHISMTR